MAVAGPSILVLLVLAGLLLAGAALLVALIVNKQTRPFGLVIGGLCAGAAVLVVAYVAVARVESRVQATHAHAVAAQQMAMQQHRELLGRDSVAASDHFTGQMDWPVAASEDSTVQMDWQATPAGQFRKSRFVAWSGILLLLLALSLAYLVLKLLNGKRGLSGPAVMGVGGLCLLLLLGFLRIGSHRQTVEIDAPMTASQAWDQVTRPRIQLGEPAGSIVLQASQAGDPALRTGVVLGPETTNDAILEQVQRMQKRLGAGEELSIKINGSTSKVRGRTSRSTVSRIVADARSKPAGEGGVQYTVTANGKELTFNDHTDIDEAVNKIEQIWRDDNKRLEFDFGIGHLRYTGAFSPDSIQEALQLALSHARRLSVAQAAAAEGEEPAADVEIGKELKIVVNGLELRFDASTKTSELVEQIKQFGGESQDRFEVQMNDAWITLKAGSPDEVVVKLLAAARPESQPTAEVVSASEFTPEPSVTNTKLAQTQEKPDWVTQPPKRIGEIYRQVVTAGPYSTVDECYQNLGPKLMEAAQEFAASHLPQKPSASFLQQLGITSGALMRDVGVDEYVELVHSESIGQDMKQLYVQVEFDQPFLEKLERAYAVWQRRDVIKGLTMLSGGVLVLVGGVLGLLKIDEATKGYYSKRLFLGVPAVIIGLLLSAMFFIS